MPALLRGGQRGRGLRGEETWVTIRLPPVLPSLSSAHAAYEARGQRFWGLFRFSGLCFLSVGKRTSAFPTGRHAGGFRANTAGLTQLVRRQVWTKHGFSHLHQYPDELAGLRRGRSIPLCPRCKSCHPQGTTQVTNIAAAPSEEGQCKDEAAPGLQFPWKHITFASRLPFPYTCL